jgi:hypothetical protein
MFYVPIYPYYRLSCFGVGLPSTASLSFSSPDLNNGGNRRTKRKRTGICFDFTSLKNWIYPYEKVPARLPHNPTKEIVNFLEPWKIEVLLKRSHQHSERKTHKWSPDRSLFLFSFSKASKQRSVSHGILPCLIRMGSLGLLSALLTEDIVLSVHFTRYFRLM